MIITSGESHEEKAVCVFIRKSIPNKFGHHPMPSDRIRQLGLLVYFLPHKLHSFPYYRHAAKMSINRFEANVH